MKPYTIAGVLVGCSFVASMAFASTLFGPIQRLAINPPGLNQPGSTHVSILMQGDTVCSGNNGWFVYDRADFGLGLVLTNALLAAYESERPVYIVGSGECGLGAETVNRVNLDLWYTAPPTKGGDRHGKFTVYRHSDPPD
jgi:hypothetical protein